MCVCPFWIEIKMKRRDFIKSVTLGSAALTLPGILSAQTGTKPLAMPPLIDATSSGKFELTAQSGTVNFLGKSDTNTVGFNGNYLGPTLRVRQGNTGVSVRNEIGEVVTVHWHGLLIPGDVDGGPHQPIAPGQDWSITLPIDQPSATTWYHSHVHGRTAPHVYYGFAGMMHVTDGRDAERDLPIDYGIDDLSLVLQDRQFDGNGRMVYAPSMHSQMMGFTGDTMMVNGQVGRTAPIPKSIVRLRLLNGSNARIYNLSFANGRVMHLVATDGGFLSAPVAIDELKLAPGERAEVLVDFTEGRGDTLVSADVANSMMGGGGGILPARKFTVLPFAVDDSLPARQSRIPDVLDGTIPELNPKGAMLRRLSLDMARGGMMMRGGAGGHSINGQPFDMERIDFTIGLGSTERWVIEAPAMMHPFHIHGVSFQVVSENGAAPSANNQGWKDTVLVDKQTEVLVRFGKPAAKDRPYMFHCHILEHEDGGMMGQFSVA